MINDDDNDNDGNLCDGCDGHYFMGRSVSKKNVFMKIRISFGFGSYENSTSIVPADFKA